MSTLTPLEPGVLDGVTKPTLDKIKSTGITTVEALSVQFPKELAEQSGMGEDTASNAIRKALEFVGAGFMTGKQLHERQSKRLRLKTGSSKLDWILGGGIETEITTEFVGEFGSGKSQIAHTAAVLAQLPLEEGGLDGMVAVIDTEGTFDSRRIIEIAEARGLDPEKTLDNIHIAVAFNTPHQIILIEGLHELCTENNIKLIIIDSMMGHMRSEYVGRGMLGARQDQLKTALQKLMKTAQVNKVAVIFTNQVMDKPDIMYGNPVKPIGGHIMAHASTVRVMLTKGKGPRRYAEIIDASYLPPEKVPFRITTAGIEDDE